MPRQITRFSVHQTSKVVGILYVVLGLVGAVFLLFGALAGGDGTGLVFALLAPALYGVLGYLVTALLCWVYNVVAERMGGIEFELSDEVRGAEPPPRF